MREEGERHPGDGNQAVRSQFLHQPFDEDEAAEAKDIPLRLPLVARVKGTCSCCTFPFSPAACEPTGYPTALPTALPAGPGMLHTVYPTVI